ncbi:MAG: phosphohydrolase, partial [Candidatus Moranbacteria bacterium]|nr:phosphohydrolase [Candidatus Moranbacteria bacterium]
MITKKDIEKIEKIAKQYFVGASGCHDWSHVERVRKLALQIGK